MHLAKVKLAWQGLAEPIWNHEIYRFSRIPMVGEYVSWQTADRHWFRVNMVAHTPMENDYDALVWAVEIEPALAEQEISSGVAVTPGD